MTKSGKKNLNKLFQLSCCKKKMEYKSIRVFTTCIETLLHFVKNLENLIWFHKVEHIIFQLQKGNKNVVRHFRSSPMRNKKGYFKSQGRT